MTHQLLTGLRVVEVSAFIAAPLAGLTLAQLGAEVIRIDPPGGGIDAGRWPLAPDGRSLYWEGLNRGKRSVCLDLKTTHGQAALHGLLRGRDRDGGILLTNLNGPDYLSFDTLRAVRPDLIKVALRGNSDGTGAVDYTVNAAVGVPMMTGPEGHPAPVNNQLPAWDAAAGLTLATALLAALRARDRTGAAQRIEVALLDVATAFMSSIGAMAEAELTGADRPRIGNGVYGAYGDALPTSDGRWAMVVCVTSRHWRALVEASGIDAAGLAARTGQDLTTDAGRFASRGAITAALSDWSRGLTLAQLARALDAAHVLWGPYRTMTQMLAEDERLAVNPMIHWVEGPDSVRHRVAGSPIRPTDLAERGVPSATRLGADTDAVLAELGLSTAAA